MRPHRHRPGKWELLSVLAGACKLILFEDDGKIAERIALTSGDAVAVEIPGGRWHTIIFGPGVLLEVKPGPYEPDLDKEFATWAPPEEDHEAARAYLQRLTGASEGGT